MISDDRLGEIVDFAESFGRHPKLDECASMAKEIMAYRQAFNNPVAWEVKGVYCGSYSEAKSMFPQRMPCPLFEKPIIPERQI